MRLFSPSLSTLSNSFGIAIYSYMSQLACSKYFFIALSGSPWSVSRSSHFISCLHIKLYNLLKMCHLLYMKYIHSPDCPHSIYASVLRDMWMSIRVSYTRLSISCLPSPLLSSSLPLPSQHSPRTESTSNNSISPW